MTLPTRRWLILAAALLIAGVLAFPLRETIYQVIVVPAAFIAWGLNLFYRSLPQAVWWWLIILIVFFMFASSLIPSVSFRRRIESNSRPQSGQVEMMAVSLKKAQRGVYFKWLVANRLGKLAYQILLHRESGRPRSVFAPLLGTDWKPTRELQTYLETGLHGSFADFPHVRRPFGAVPKTPLDVEVVEVIEFLESQINQENV